MELARLVYGTFPEDHEIDSWRLIRLWVAEGIPWRDKLRSLEEVAEDCLEDLASRNLIMVSRKKLNAKNSEIPRFSMHARISLEKFSKPLQVVRSLYLFEEPHEPTRETSEFETLRVLTIIPRSYSIFHHRITLDSAILRYLETWQLFQVLKLRDGAFRGEVWKLNEEDQFNQLKFLLFVDESKIERWEASHVNFPNLQRLVLQRMNHKLEQIPLAFAEICTLESIELYKCYNTESAREVASVAGYDCLRVGVDDFKFQLPNCVSK
ncbi:hypothetical protein HAX54_022399 [Datura stramonium]|uniref:Disease resistance protein winged helix domain-containing protein n=1 Tax=Datura stramonium TaxID=4076 RepID=A0ABS8RJR3_DATST|nr:hypothetical protein [Datura stramonium]